MIQIILFLFVLEIGTIWNTFLMKIFEMFLVQLEQEKEDAYKV